MASIVFDAALSAREDPRRRISYSRRKAFYAAAGRYLGTGYGYDTVVPAVDALVEAGTLVEHDKVKGGRATGWQSSFRPADHLADVVLPKAERHAGELVRLKDRDGNLVAYRDTNRTARDRRFLEAVNECIIASEIRLDAPGATADGHVLRFGNHVVYPHMNSLYRVYNGAWTLGGRMYGGWWQQVRADDRRHFLLDGGATCEEDYPQLHPRLLYALAGRRLDGDAYTLDGWDRKACKRAFNILLNADSYHRAKGALLPHLDGDEDAAVALIQEMKRRHPAVARHFHSGMGIRLQHLDSQMAASVLQELTVRRDITVLPVHDSFIVREEHRPNLLDAMERALSQQLATVGNSSAGSSTYGTNYPHRKGGKGGKGRGVRAAPDCAVPAGPAIPGRAPPRHVAEGTVMRAAPMQAAEHEGKANPGLETAKSCGGQPGPEGRASMLSSPLPQRPAPEVHLRRDRPATAGHRRRSQRAPIKREPHDLRQRDGDQVAGAVEALLLETAAARVLTNEGGGTVIRIRRVIDALAVENPTLPRLKEGAVIAAVAAAEKRACSAVQ